MSVIKIPYGLEVPTGRIIHVGEAVRGKACNCVCLGCGSPLLARKGPQNPPHFAHEGDRICGGYQETLLHKTSKQIIRESYTIRLPSLALYTLGTNGRITGKYSIIEVKNQFIKYDQCVEEEYVYAEGIMFKPDLILKKRDTPLIIEIAVTHHVDSEKEAKIINSGYSALEIDLSWVGLDFNYKELRNIILNRLNIPSKDQISTPFKRWINNEKFNKVANGLRSSGKTIKPETVSGPHPYDDFE
jgi:hypothetical protein